MGVNKMQQYEIPTFVMHCNETKKCTKCIYMFKETENMFDHYMLVHGEWFLNLISAGERQLGFTYGLPNIPLDPERTYDEPLLFRYCQENEKCPECNYEFGIGDSFLVHCEDFHQLWFLNILYAGEKALGLLNDFTPDIKIKEPEIGEPNTEEYEKRGFKAPRCNACHHNDPMYTCVSNDERGIRIKCDYCGDITVK